MEKKEYEGIELTDLTLKLLEKTEILRKSIEYSMMIGYTNVLRGIDIFNMKIIEFNFESITAASVEVLKSSINDYLDNDDNIFEFSSTYINYGLDCCYSIINYFALNKVKNRIKKK